MIKFFGKATILALAALSATAAVNCSSNSTKPVPSDNADQSGTVGLQLQAAPGVFINTVNYTITGPGGFTRTGTIDVSNSDVITATIGGLPAGTGYTITLTANATDGGITCTGAANFDVIARSTTSVTVHLTCQRPKNTGSVLVNGTLNICPVIDSVSSTAPVGGVIQLSSTASDLDSAPAPLSFSWEVLSGPGTLTNANTAGAQVNCSANGTVSLRLTVSDGDNVMGCPDTFTTQVSCVGVAATTGAGGAGGSGGSGGSTGGSGGSTGGSGGSTGGSTGGSVVDSGPPPRTVSSLLGAHSAACLTCMQAACQVEMDTCQNIMGVAAAGPAAGVSKQTLCLDTLECVEATHPTCGSALLGTCYCGTAAGAACLNPGSPNGVCLVQTERGLETTSPAQIATDFTRPDLGAGAAYAMLQCAGDNGCDACLQ